MDTLDTNLINLPVFLPIQVDLIGDTGYTLDRITRSSSDTDRSIYDTLGTDLIELQDLPLIQVYFIGYTGYLLDRTSRSSPDTGRSINSLWLMD